MTTPRPEPLHGTPDAPHLAVQGQATLEADPELARLDITVLARAADRRAALADLTRRNDTVLELVRSHGDAVEKLDTSAFTVTPELGKGRGERVRAHHGRVHLRATLRDLTVLGDLTGRLTALDLIRVDGPVWSLRPDSAAYRTARTQAVHDAVRRAEEYADALGARVVALLELSDQGLDTVVRSHRANHAFGAHRSVAPTESDPEAQPPLDLEPERQTVTASVTAHFTMTRPDLG